MKVEKTELQVKNKVNSLLYSVLRGVVVAGVVVVGMYAAGTEVWSAPIAGGGGGGDSGGASPAGGIIPNPGPKDEDKWELGYHGHGCPSSTVVDSYADNYYCDLRNYPINEMGGGVTYCGRDDRYKIPNQGYVCGRDSKFQAYPRAIEWGGGNQCIPLPGGLWNTDSERSRRIYDGDTNNGYFSHIYGRDYVNGMYPVGNNVAIYFFPTPEAYTRIEQDPGNDNPDNDNYPGYGDFVNLRYLKILDEDCWTCINTDDPNCFCSDGKSWYVKAHVQAHIDDGGEKKWVDIHPYTKVWHGDRAVCGGDSDWDVSPKAEFPIQGKGTCFDFGSPYYARWESDNGVAYCNRQFWSGAGAAPCKQVDAQGRGFVGCDPDGTTPYQPRYLDTLKVDAVRIFYEHTTGWTGGTTSGQNVWVRGVWWIYEGRSSVPEIPPVPDCSSFNNLDCTLTASTNYIGHDDRVDYSVRYGHDGGYEKLSRMLFAIDEERPNTDYNRFRNGIFLEARREGSTINAYALRKRTGGADDWVIGGVGFGTNARFCFYDGSETTYTTASSCPGNPIAEVDLAGSSVGVLENQITVNWRIKLYDSFGSGRQVVIWQEAQDEDGAWSEDSDPAAGRQYWHWTNENTCVLRTDFSSPTAAADISVASASTMRVDWYFSETGPAGLYQVDPQNCNPSPDDSYISVADRSRCPSGTSTSGYATYTLLPSLTSHQYSFYANAMDRACNTADGQDLINIGERWMKTELGDVFVTEEINVTPLPSEYFSTYICSTSQSSFGELPSGRESERGYVIVGYTDPNQSRWGNWNDEYATLRSLAESNNGGSLGSLDASLSDDIASLGDGVYETPADQDVTLEGNPSGITCNNRVLIFVNGTLTISPNILRGGSAESGCMFIVRDNVNVNAPTGTSTITDEGSPLDRIDAFIVAGGAFNVANANNVRLRIRGGVLANTAVFNRDLILADNNQWPAENVIYDPRYAVMFSQYFVDEEGYQIREVGVKSLD